MEKDTFVEWVGSAVELAGVAVIVLGTAIATFVFVRSTLRERAFAERAYEAYRRSLGRAIILGLEFLVAGDIIRTVAVTPTFTDLGVLAVIVAIRTFLSFTLQLEIEGRWPWQPRPPREDGSAVAGGAR